MEGEAVKKLIEKYIKSWKEKDLETFFKNSPKNFILK